MLSGLRKRLRWVLLTVVGFALLFAILEQLLNLIAIYKPKRLHQATRKLLKHVNRVYLWAVYRFDLGRHSEEVIVIHKGRRSGSEYATPLCVSHCDEGFIIGAYWGPTADWLLNLRATPAARVRYQGEYHDVEAEVITLHEAHRRMGGPSICGCWERGRAEYCVLLRPAQQASLEPDEVVMPLTADGDRRIRGGIATVLLIAALVASCGTDTPATTLASIPETDLAELFTYTPTPLDISEAAMTTEAGVEVRDISYAGNGDARVEAYLVTPEDGGPFAGVVFMHWGGGSRLQFLDEAKALAADGIVSLLVNAEWRPQRAHFIDTVIALRRGADLLGERPNVDAARLGYVGHSWGASFGAILAGVDQRFATYILMAGVPSLADFLDDPELNEFDAAPYLGAAPSPSLLFQVAEQDENVSPERAQEFYDIAGEPKSIEWYPTTHRFVDLDAARDRAVWLREQLG